MQLQLFDPTRYNTLIFNNFLNSKLGRLYSTIPFSELAAPFKGIKSAVGVVGNFSIKGGIGLMVLKHHLVLSDEELIERLNTDWHLQFFCGLAKKDNHGIKDGDVVGRWRAFFGQNLDLERFQSTFIEEWRDEIEHKNLCVMDASVYESYIKYPTDWNLLWDCCIWVKKLMRKLCGMSGQKMPRSRFGEQARKQLAFSKRKRKTHKQKRRRIRQLLYLLEKLLGQYEELVWPGCKNDIKLSERQQSRIKTVKTILSQQKELFENGKDTKVSGRIVSLFKPYVRPIVRGKAGKRTEFGAKVHLMQVGRIGIIEHLNFNAFHEGIRMNRTLALHTKFFGKPSQVSGDRIYATNANRTMCAKMSIATGFTPKGRRGKDEKERKKLRKAINKERATALEGSFGNNKNHYGLAKVKARTEATEIAWIVFGTWTANAVRVMNIRRKKAKKAA